jgi:hypothetical protein
MWLSLDTDMQYCFEGDINPVAFFKHLPLLLVPTDTLVLGCYDARPDIRRFLVEAAIPAAWDQFHPTETWDINRKEHPDGAAFHIRADSRTLQQLTEFAGSVTEHTQMCDHLAAYSAEYPVLIYHGTFWEPLFVSTRISRGSVEAFSQAIGVSFDEIDFYKTYPSAAPLSGEPNG